MKILSRPSKVLVFLKSEDPSTSTASHSATKTLTLEILNCAGTARWTDGTQTAIQLLTSETWRQVKDRIRGTQFSHLYGHKVKTPKLLPVGPHSVGNLDLSYPAKGQETVIHPHHAMRQACLAACVRQEANA